MREKETKNTLQALSQDLAEVVEQIGQSVVAVNARRYGSSSGVYWRNDAIVTAAHAIRRTEDISVILPSGQMIEASFAGADPSTDLAVLKVNSVTLSIPGFGDAAQIKVGHVVLAVGRGAQRGLNATVGIVGVLSGAWHTWRGGAIDHFIGLDLALHPGAAGGPLVDAHGLVLGINSPALSRNVPLTVPVSTVNRVVEQLLEKGHITRAYLGLGTQPLPLPEELKNAMNLTAGSGLIVVSVDPEGPGSKAGVVFGDVIVAFEGTPVSSVRDLQAFLEPSSVGKTIAVSLILGGKRIAVNVIIGERTRSAD